MEKKPMVLMTNPMSPYLQTQISTHFNLIKLWDPPPNFNNSIIKAIVCDTKLGANSVLVDSLPGLEIVASYSVGFDKIDMNKCKERGVMVTNTPDVLTDDVADVAVGLIIAVLRKFSGKSIGIIGLGRIGSAIAKRTKAFGCTISYHSRTMKQDTDYSYYSNVVDLAANREVIDALGPKGILINIGRGAHVDEVELVSALREGRIAGAGLDVFENEPNVPESLFTLQNVVMLPHVGSDTVETSQAMADLVVANLEAHFSGKQLLTPVL